jgi:DNA-binding SARP family transcriptional activator
VEEFKALAGKVICRQGAREDVLEALRRISGDYEDCKLAVIGNDPWIAGHQQRLTALLVDSLLAGVHIYRELRQFDNALWFARRVYEVDPTREDVCQAYMQAQFECGQRASAIRTYLACRRYLTDELGILPSARTNEIYQGIILDRH